MRHKAVDDYANASKFVPDWYNTKEKCDKFVSENPFLLKFCHDRYKKQEICDKVVDSFLLALKFVPDWFVTNKTIKKLCTGLFPNEGILFW